MPPSQDMRCGFVSVVGSPNAGKSTLINALVGEKVSIVSKRVQTTRSRILGIAIHGNAQIILMDTPGIFAPQKNLEKAMVGAAFETLDDADIIIHLVDAGRKSLDVKDHEMIIEMLPKNTRCILALNKTDKTKKPNLLALAQALNERFDYDATYMISSLKKQGLETLKDDLVTHIPQSVWLFDSEQTSDMPMRLMAAEITREKIFNALYQELPYATFVETENWEEFDNGSIKISQVVHVQTNSQKAIVLGKGGSQIKQIGQEARLELEDIMDSRVHLKIFVKVQKDWDEKPENYRLIGLDI